VRPPSRWAHQPPVVRFAMVVGKNLLGALLMLAGIAMLVLPGQGLLTMFVGFLLIDFPGKYRFEKWLMARSYLIRPINWLRRRRNRPPLQVAPFSEPPDFGSRRSRGNRRWETTENARNE
jgi:hypothetical protein